MTAAQDAPAPGGTPGTRRVHWRRLLWWTLAIVVGGAFANLVGWDVVGWFSDLWHTITEISVEYLIAGVLLMGVQTTATAYAWYGILKFAYPDGTTWRDVLATYAVAVALNSVLPANLGSVVMMIMFTVLIPAATFAGVLAGFGVEKIFFTIAGAFVYLYLFLTVAGSFDVKFEFVHERPVATAVLLGGGVFLLYLLVRRLWPRVLHWWEQAKEGGAIVGHPKAYFGRVFFPSLVGWLAMLAGTGVFLAAYGIPVSFDTLMHVSGGNSIANTVSFTPGGAGVTQAFNVASLNGVTDPATATAYSVSHQLVGVAWNLLYACVLMIWAWGWSGGKDLVRQSYEDAKQRQQEERERHRERKAAKAAGQEGVAG